MNGVVVKGFEVFGELECCLNVLEGYKRGSFWHVCSFGAWPYPS